MFPLGHRSSHLRSGRLTVAPGVKRLRPISRDVRRSTEVNRDLLYDPDEHLERDAEFPPKRGLQGRRCSDVGSDVGTDPRVALTAHSETVGASPGMPVRSRMQGSSISLPTRHARRL